MVARAVNVFFTKQTTSYISPYQFFKVVIRKINSGCLIYSFYNLIHMKHFQHFNNSITRQLTFTAKDGQIAMARYRIYSVVGIVRLLKVLSFPCRDFLGFRRDFSDAKLFAEQIVASTEVQLIDCTFKLCTTDIRTNTHSVLR